MTRKIDIPTTSRDFYFTPAGDDAWSGASSENAVTNPAVAIDRVNALIPPPSSTQPASINADQTGASSVGITTPDFTTINCEFASIVTTDAINVDIGNRQSIQWGALVNLADNGINCQIDGKTRVSLAVNALVVGNDGATGLETFDNIGIKIAGASEDIFVMLRQVVLSGERAIGLEHTATTTTPIIYKIEKAEFFNEDQTLIKINNGAGERIEVDIDTVKRGTSATEPTTNSLIFDAVTGQINVSANSLDADMIGRVADGAQLGLTSNTCTGDLLIEDGGECLLRSGVLNGDITIDTGGRLEAIINVHAGTITNNGTLNGIINGICYGTYCHDVKLIAASFVNQEPTLIDTPLQIEFGSAQGTGSDPVQLASDGTITFNDDGFYTVTVGVQYGRANINQVAVIHFRLLLNGTQVGNSATAVLSTDTEDVPYSVSFGGTVEAGDAFTVEIIRDSTGTNDGGLFTKSVTAAGWTDSPSASIRISR